jgi:hypothetical protein
MSCVLMFISCQFHECQVIRFMMFECMGAALDVRCRVGNRLERMVLGVSWITECLEGSGL